MESGKEDIKLPDIFSLVAGITGANSQVPVSAPSSVPPTPAPSPANMAAPETATKEEPMIQPISPALAPPGDEGALQEYGCGPEDVPSLSSWYFMGYPSADGESDPHAEFYATGGQLGYGEGLPVGQDLYGAGGEERDGGGQAVSFLTHQGEDPSLAAASLPPHCNAVSLAELGGGAYAGPGAGPEGEAWLAVRGPQAGLLGDSGYLSEWSDSPHPSTRSSSAVSTPERPQGPGCLGGLDLEEVLELPRFPQEAFRQLTLTDPTLLRPTPHPSLTQLSTRPGPGGGLSTRRQLQSNDVSSSLTRGQHPHPSHVTALRDRPPLREMSNAAPHGRPPKRRPEFTRHETSAEKRSRHNQPLNNNAIRVMTDWYESHLDHPYPTKMEKAHLAAEGCITVMQVKSWFANKRNRSNNTRPKVQKKMLEEKLQNLCQQLAVMSRQAAAVDSSYLIQQLSSLIRQ